MNRGAFGAAEDFVSRISRQAASFYISLKSTPDFEHRYYAFSLQRFHPAHLYASTAHQAQQELSLG